MHPRNILLSAAAVATLGAGAALSVLPDRVPDDDLVIRINLPAYELELWDGDEVLRSWTVTIGAKGHATPTGEFSLDRITWNPWWHPPDSDWARGEKKTPPGPNNPMGRVKMRFYKLVFIHGTTREDQLGQAASHGCIRMANADALELARLIAERRGLLDSGELSRVEANTRATREIGLDRPVPVVVSYRLAEDENGEVRTYEDVYDRGMRPHERELAESTSAGSASSSGGA